MLTSITTVAGLYPLIYEESEQAQFLIPMAISMAYGVLFGTLFILLIFPILIIVMNDIGQVWRFTVDYIKALWSGTMGTLEYPTREEVEPSIRERERLKIEM